jgi:hypothetical protein
MVAEILSLTRILLSGVFAGMTIESEPLAGPKPPESVSLPTTTPESPALLLVVHPPPPLIEYWICTEIEALPSPVSDERKKSPSYDQSYLRVIESICPKTDWNALQRHVLSVDPVSPCDEVVAAWPMFVGVVTPAPP